MLKYTGVELDNIRRLYLIYARAYIRLDPVHMKKIKEEFETFDEFISEQRHIGTYLAYVMKLNKKGKVIDNLQKNFHKGLGNIAPSEDVTLRKIKAIFNIPLSFTKFKEHLFADETIMQMVHDEMNCLGDEFDNINSDLSNFIMRRNASLQQQLYPQRFLQKETAKNFGPINSSQQKGLSALNLEAKAASGNWRGMGENIDIRDKVQGFSNNKYSFDANVDISVVGEQITIEGTMVSIDPLTKAIIHKNVRIQAEGRFIPRHAILIYTVQTNDFFSYGTITIRFYGIDKSNWCLVGFRPGEDNRVFAWLELTKTKQ